MVIHLRHKSHKKKGRRKGAVSCLHVYIHVWQVDGWLLPYLVCHGTVGLASAWLLSCLRFNTTTWGTLACLGMVGARRGRSAHLEVWKEKWAQALQAWVLGKTLTRICVVWWDVVRAHRFWVHPPTALLPKSSSREKAGHRKSCGRWSDTVHAGFHLYAEGVCKAFEEIKSY